MTASHSLTGTSRTQRLIAMIALAFSLCLGITTLTTTPAHAALSKPLESGDMIYIEDNGMCTVTVISTRYAITAGHCGEEGKKVEVYGEVIGTITYNGLQQKAGYDFARITLKPGTPTKVAPSAPRYKPNKGDAISKNGDASTWTHGTVLDPTLINKPAKLNGNSYPARIWTAKLVSYKGDSGAPVYHKGKVIGILKGGPAQNNKTTYVTPLSEIIGYM
ncbi:trypsin-like serine protease [Rothia sp. P4278]|uniref:trypsin-like serine protease n=1 Tax=Rothia sp. P4278 TaxID=3402658 RepID=UPI003ADCABB3